MDETHVVTAFLRNAGDILLTRRSDAVGTYRDHWAGVSGYAEGDPDSQVWTELREETGLDEDAVSLVRAGDELPVVDGDRHWVVHPYLFDTSTRDVMPNEELAAVEWVPPTAIRDDDRRTVPGLWAAYDRIRPSVDTIEADREHGSAYLSLRALDVLRDEAALADDWAGIAGVARDLLDARPDMAAVRNRVNRAMFEASQSGWTPAAVEQAANSVSRTAASADADAAAAAADLVEGRSVATFSRSGTVIDAILSGTPPSVAISESRPGREGIAVAEELADADMDVTLTPDAALPTLLSDYDVVLVGADSITPEGSIVNKVGTRALALAARAADVPFYAVCAADKISTEPTTPTGQADPETLPDGADDIQVEAPLFDVTPTDLVSGIVTEDGILDGDDVQNRAQEHRRTAEWE